MKQKFAKKNLLEKLQVKISRCAQKNQTWHNVALIFERHGGACYIGLRSWIMDPVGTKSIFDSVFWKSTFSIKIRSKIDLWFFWNDFFRNGASWPKSVCKFVKLSLKCNQEHFDPKFILGRGAGASKTAGTPKIWRKSRKIENIAKNS